MQKTLQELSRPKILNMDHRVCRPLFSNPSLVSTSENSSRCSLSCRKWHRNYSMTNSYPSSPSEHQGPGMVIWLPLSGPRICQFGKVAHPSAEVTAWWFFVAFQEFYILVFLRFSQDNFLWIPTSGDISLDAPPCHHICQKYLHF